MKNNIAVVQIDQILDKISNYIDSARNNILRSIDTEMVTAYWLIGREIVEEEQKGQERAKYGSYLLSELSVRLTSKYSKGFSLGNLKHIRQFYIAYQDYCPIGYALRSQFNKELNPNLSWLHYRTLMRVTRDDARSFYEIETIKIIGLGVSWKGKLIAYYLKDWH